MKATTIWSLRINDDKWISACVLYKGNFEQITFFRCKFNNPAPGTKQCISGSWIFQNLKYDLLVERFQNHFLSFYVKRLYLILFWITLVDFLYPCFEVHWLIKWRTESGELFPSSHFDWHKRNSTDFLTTFATVS